ncbi:MAG: Cytosolic Fe-S cluster assembly factor nar1 [Sclerophora amabilis]|nr:MAG: Cytosolic Fe-S cluster assembly factor nar1 [Sclerophora amabilis]
MSAILSADDLNDFISPGVACIKPVETFSEVKPEDSTNPYEVTTEDKVPAESLPPAQISLTDCLACSGCVTSAEAVLVSLQSQTEVLNALDSRPSVEPQVLQRTIDGCTQTGEIDELNAGTIFIASVSPQTRASVAATYGITEREAGHLIEQLLSGPQGIKQGGDNQSGFTWVVDTNVAREACLVLGAEEVIDTPSEGIGAKILRKGDNASLVDSKKPILTSACPGWVCYAEKTHPHVLPHLSRLKSPQALLGTLLKTSLSKTLGVSPDKIWHLAIMPCFDKKLEASRQELTDLFWEPDQQSGKGVRDVDCVITTRELPLLAEARGISLPNLPHKALPKSSWPRFPDPVLDRFLFPRSQPLDRRRNPRNGRDPAGGTSGGYLYHILRTLQTQHPGSKIIASRGRNADVVEYTLAQPDTTKTPIFKAARYYGFRNIQNLVRRLKPPKVSRLPGGRPVGASRRPGGPIATSSSEYAYVEVMACPGGCTNGGAQMRIEDALAVANGDVAGSDNLSQTSKPGLPERKAWLSQVDEAYFSADGSDSDPESKGDLADNNGINRMNEMFTDSDGDEFISGINATYVHRVLDHWSDLTSIDLSKLAYTSFREVESDVGKSKDLKGDTERVVELAGRIGGGW